MAGNLPEEQVRFDVGSIPYNGITDAMEDAGMRPICPYCHKPATPADDHGRYVCFCRGYIIIDGVTGLSHRPRPIPQVDTTGMSDEDKAQIAPIHRLDAQPTAAEAELLRLMLTGGPDALGSDEYVAAQRALKVERGELSADEE